MDFFFVFYYHKILKNKRKVWQETRLQNMEQKLTSRARCWSKGAAPISRIICSRMSCSFEELSTRSTKSSRLTRVRPDRRTKLAVDAEAADDDDEEEEEAVTSTEAAAAAAAGLELPSFKIKDFRGKLQLASPSFRFAVSTGVLGSSFLR